MKRHAGKCIHKMKDSARQVGEGFQEYQDETKRRVSRAALALQKLGSCSNQRRRHCATESIPFSIFSMMTDFVGISPTITFILEFDVGTC